MGDNGYALDLLSAARHVATELERAAPAALSVSALAAGYRHPNPGDISRVKQHEGCPTDDDARDWIIQKSLDVLRRRKASRDAVEEKGGSYRLVTKFEDLEWVRGRKLHRDRNDHVKLRDPFNPMSGEFAENIRRLRNDDPTELRESMQTFGWVEELPAIKDERGVILVGHRRLAIAEELGITPVIKTVKLGDGDEADAKRFRLAVASNLGGKPFTKTERQRIAAYLYADHDWSMERVAEALNVNQATVSRDLHGIMQDAKPHQRRGRPQKLTPEQEQAIIEGYFDQGKPLADLERDVLGVERKPNNHRTSERVRRVIDEERGRREERALREAGQCRCPSCGAVHPLDTDQAASRS